MSTASDKLTEKFQQQLEEMLERQLQAEEEAREKISSAKIRLMKLSPFFSALLFRMPMVANYDVPAMATDGLIILYNPVWVADLKRKDLVFVMLHEMQHILFKHPMRCPVSFESIETYRDMMNRATIEDPFLKAQMDDLAMILQKFNHAADYVINLNIRDNVGIKPTDYLTKDFGILMEDGFREMTTEQVYKNLPDPDPNKPSEPGIGDFVPVGFGELDATEAKDAEGELEQNVHAAAVMAKKAGNLPGGISKIIEDLYTTTTPWQDIIRTQISSVVAKMDYTWLKPNRRFAQHLQNFGVIMPGLDGEEYADMYFVMDTSGSVSENDRAILVSELKKILEDYAVKIHLIFCDTKVHGDPIVLTQDDIRNGKLQIELKGYGGTDFRPAFQYINNHMDEIEPEMVVYITDMYPNTWNLGKEPPYSVYWGVLPQGDQNAQPPWGTIVNIQLEE